MRGRPCDVRARSAQRNLSVYAHTRGPVRHSWLSVAWTRVKGTAANVVATVPIVGGAAANIIDGIHTGDEHVNPVTGQWESNATGEVVSGPPTGALKAQIDQTEQFNRDEVARLRQQVADLAAKGGIAAGAAIGPKGNIYQQIISTATQNPIATFLAFLVVAGVLYLVVAKD